jgi:hypothetical protein
MSTNSVHAAMSPANSSLASLSKSHVDGLTSYSSLNRCRTFNNSSPQLGTKISNSSFGRFRIHQPRSITAPGVRRERAMASKHRQYEFPRLKLKTGLQRSNNTASELAWDEEPRFQGMRGRKSPRNRLAAAGPNDETKQYSKDKIEWRSEYEVEVEKGERELGGTRSLPMGVPYFHHGRRGCRGCGCSAFALGARSLGFSSDAFRFFGHGWGSGLNGSR